MTTHRAYKCNLCGDEIKPSPHASKEGFGVHFTAAGASVFKRTFETEHHICHRCAQSVHDELRKRVPAPAISAGDAVFAFAAAQPPADGALNTIAAMFHSGEEIEGPDGLAVMVDMSVWEDALDAFDEISGDEMEPAHPTAGIWVPTELAERVQETMGEFLMDHGWRQQDMDTSDEFGALLAVATKAAPASQDAARTQQEDKSGADHDL